MSKPSFSNIDLWLFELAEGNLNEHQKEQLKIFLLQNPDLDVDKDAWEWAHVDKSNVIYPDQDLLIKKSPSRKIFMYSSAAVMLLLFVGCYEIYMRQDVNQSMAKPNINNSANGESDRSFRQMYGDEFSNVVSGNTNNKSNGLSQLSNNWLVANVWSENHMKNESLVALNLNANSSSSDVISSDDLIVQAIQNIYNEDPIGYPSSEKLLYSYLHPKDIKGVMSAYQYEKKGRSRGEYQSSSRSSGGDYQASFSQKFKKAARKVKRMLDNPVALNNYRDPHYHLPGAMHNDVNFSSSGTLIRTRVQSLSRLQWLGQENEQLLNTVAVDGYSYGMRGGWGVQLNNGYYKNGKLNVSSAAFTYSPKFSVNSVISIEPSVRFKLGYKMLNTNAMNGTNQLEVDRGNVIDYYPNGGAPVGKSIWYKDMGAGLMVNTEWFFVGVQLDNLFRHREMMYDNNISVQNRSAQEVFASAGTDWESRSKKMTLSPYVVYHHNQDLSEMWLGMNYSVKRNVMKNNYFTMGAAVSSSLEPAASIGMKFERFSIIYNADYSQSYMTNNKSLSHQLVLRFMSDQPKHLGRNLMNRGI